MDLKSSEALFPNDSDTPEEESTFTTVDFFQVNDGFPTHFLKAKHLTSFSESGINDFVLPRGEAYTKDTRKYYYEGDKGRLLKNEGMLHLDGNVFLKEGLSQLRSDRATYDFPKDYFHSWGNVRSEGVDLKTKDKIYVNSQEAFSWPKKQLGHYLGNVVGKIVKKRPYEPGVDFKANKMTVDLNKSHIELQENVYLHQEEVKAYSLRGEIFLENYNEKLRYYALYDDVKVVERIPVIKNDGQDSGSWNSPPKANSFIERRAYAEKLEGYVREEKIVLTGYPKVIQEKDVIKGNIITLLKRNEVIEVDDSNSSFILKE